jgi:hypothetical protein
MWLALGWVCGGVATSFEVGDEFWEALGGGGIWEMWDFPDEAFVGLGWWCSGRRGGRPVDVETRDVFV